MSGVSGSSLSNAAYRRSYSQDDERSSKRYKVAGASSSSAAVQVMRTVLGSSELNAERIFPCLSPQERFFIMAQVNRQCYSDNRLVRTGKLEAFDLDCIFKKHPQFRNVTAESLVESLQSLPNRLAFMAALKKAIPHISVLRFHDWFPSLPVYLTATIIEAYRETLRDVQLDLDELSEEETGVVFGALSIHLNGSNLIRLTLNNALHVTNAHLTQLHLPKLEKFEIWYNGRGDALTSGLVTLSQRSQLKSLRAAWCLDEEGLENFRGEHLTELAIIIYKDEGSSMSSEGLTNFLMGCPSLETLEISAPKDIVNTALREASLSKLSRLSLVLDGPTADEEGEEECEELGVETVCMLFEQSPLTVLEIVGFNKVSLDVLKGLKRLVPDCDFVGIDLAKFPSDHWVALIDE